MNISEKDFLIKNILNDKIFDHNKEINDLDILFKKIENDS